ncbi:MAG: hypothetical protein OXM87_13240 [Truepera sp.]|nr:hypothetical protein [Truepera sp.]
MSRTLRLTDSSDGSLAERTLQPGHRGGGAARGLRTTFDLESTGRLYIDDCKMPAMLREVDQIQDMRPIRADRSAPERACKGVGV